ncbi:ABC transporter permease [Ornithinibacillus halophilus]|uniref:ABC-2 type transport system permease protein n=1 Tax=Ornithinibacillus halophilus TaxID=930117 RepID=A0A1M5M8X9_9BACI|nr:ABC transporter permease [Ornithinibacillus halophilus]SHG73720.1 ABC-2 type transport system permease protein [Ornithinibacillus halophilus]
MFDSHSFYKKRLTSHVKDLSRYLRYIFNGHIAFAMLFFIAALAYYYQQWLAQLPEDFPTAWVMGIVFGLIASYSPVRTLLKEPDLVFLLPAENKMGSYFRNSIIYSFVIQIYLVVLLFAAFGPLYFESFPGREGSTYLLTLIVLFIFKIWNLLANWWMLKVRDASIRYTDQIARLLLNIAVFYFLVYGEMLLAGITTVLFIVVFLYDFFLSRKQAGIAWELLIEKDRNRSQTFYRFANLFTDVPHLKTPIKKRHWLVSLISKRVPFDYKNTFDYLYRISFIRSGDYLGMYVRLIIIGGLFIYFIPNIWMKLAFALLFLYLSSFQMMTLYNHHRTIMWLDIYPVTAEMRQKALIKWLIQLIMIQTVLYSFIFLVAQEYYGVVMVLVGGFVFNYLFINGYVKRKLA